REVMDDCEYHPMARIVVIHPREIDRVGNIGVVTAGTSDIPVAEEAAVTAETLGNRVNRIYDAGVAGIHRILNVREDLFQANVAVVVAGMEGALTSVVGGLVSCPVIGVPTSIGYGASFGGVAALLCMLNSCASGVSVVNIDNGFGAGYQASQINKLGMRHGKNRTIETDAVGQSGKKDGTTDAKISLVKTS
ncbi:MAG: nickel pincer cofactor biosynthesis protein LarB, partial [Desulfobacterales bacterium]|nr:nickel pincer cofactor biosynthesis protein LarB [Desulfobacterales bacterium]